MPAERLECNGEPTFTPEGRLGSDRPPYQPHCQTASPGSPGQTASAGSGEASHSDRESNLNTLFDLWDAAEGSGLPIMVQIVDQHGNLVMRKARRPSIRMRTSMTLETVTPGGGRDTKHASLHIDHCHKTGVVRGMLCGNCNFLLGHANDSPEILRKAADYLEE